ncbi:hypothetical protein E2562_021365 [Oryza meyeriana var. granulata]|uniref:Phytocyanin domain-containing protein n=1 Tax=Oryza meyeriana var. granulata TaxID=110450 RepID=A0A6G1CHQ7_9ORYZ|nr:hypothetical protein E2562_021365 [Oryza meyeriana var. granulata]
MAAVVATMLCAALVFAAVADARDLIVGGNDGGWKVPAQPDALNKWAEATRFHVGDNLVFKFDGAADAVLEVTRDDYNRCSTASPVATYKPTGGRATVPLTRSGLHFFVGVAPGSCDKGERVIVLVMSEKHSRRGRGFFAPVPAPVPVESPLAARLFQAPTPAPATGDAGRAAASGALLVAAALLGAAVVAGL